MTSPPSYTRTKTMTPTSYASGRIVINVHDILGGNVSDVSIIYNNKTYLTGIDGAEYIHDVPFNNNFTLNFKRNGYICDPNSYKGKITKDNDTLVVFVTIFADNSYNSCNEVKIYTTNLKNYISKIYNFSKIDKNSKNKKTEKKFLQIEKLLKKLPKTAMICKNRSNFNTISYKKIKNDIKNYLKILYNSTIKINSEFKNKNKKSNKWLLKRKQKLNNLFNNAIKESTNIPDKSYVLK